MRYNVHLYREMRVFFPGIETGSPEAAADLARACSTDEADLIADCDGESFAALVDVAGDREFEHSVTIDFEGERQLKAVPALVEALGDCIRQIHALLPAYQQSASTLDNIPAVLKARAAIAAATAADGGRTLHLQPPA